VNRVGFTTTIPLEILLAAGKKPVDLNNIFITSPRSHEFVETAEMEGFPRNLCGWIKGLYSAVIETGIREVIAVTEGDCSNTRALMEVLSLHGITLIPFAYPHDRNRKSISFEIDKLMDHFGVDAPMVEATRRDLQTLRVKLQELDRLTWEENLVSGEENHRWLVSSSDMNGDPGQFQRELGDFLLEARAREPFSQGIRLAYIGVPPITDGLYPFFESRGARVVFNETQRQFSMPYNSMEMVDQYLAYTYPYDIFFRLADILPELKKRRVDAVVHYVQSFCFRQIEDMIIRKKIPLPVLTLEGDRPASLDARTKIRIEGFLEMLSP
jgi:benzoyl-CoA reductase/2-hydroxyglutaryl-CoA dehydratase subunit BcrC/BadD/HgdB